MYVCSEELISSLSGKTRNSIGLADLFLIEPDNI